VELLLVAVAERLARCCFCGCGAGGGASVLTLLVAFLSCCCCCCCCCFHVLLVATAELVLSKFTALVRCDL
jgi:hypothetical protein